MVQFGQVLEAIVEQHERQLELSLIEFGANDLPPHQRHSDTSTEAAELIAPKFGTLMFKLLEAFKNRPYSGLTDEEGQILLNMEGNTYRPCRVTLMDRGWLEDSGQRRLTRFKRKAVVWILKQPKTDELF